VSEHSAHLAMAWLISCWLSPDTRLRFPSASTITSSEAKTIIYTYSSPMIRGRSNLMMFTSGALSRVRMQWSRIRALSAAAGRVNLVTLPKQIGPFWVACSEYTELPFPTGSGKRA
jgi:hypothetical protein